MKILGVNKYRFTPREEPRITSVVVELSGEEFTGLTGRKAGDFGIDEPRAGLPFDISTAIAAAKVIRDGETAVRNASAALARAVENLNAVVAACEAIREPLKEIEG